jgi:hypothetical protein
MTPFEKWWIERNRYEDAYGERDEARAAWEAATEAASRRWLGAILAAAGTPMCKTDKECVGCGCRSLSPEEALAGLREGTR